MEAGGERQVARSDDRAASGAGAASACRGAAGRPAGLDRGAVAFRAQAVTLLPISIGAITWWLWGRGSWYRSERPVIRGEERGWVRWR